MTQEPIYAFRQVIKSVLTLTAKNEVVLIPTENRKFTILGAEKHPLTGVPTHAGEIWSGPLDGQKFWLEAGCFERIKDWADYV